MPCTVDIKNNQLYIKLYSIPQYIFYEKLEQVKSLYGKRFDDKNRIWTAPITENNIELLKFYDFEFINEAKKFIGTDLKELSERYLPEINKSLLDDKLFPFQVEGVRFLEGRNGLGGIFDQMGLGKSVQSLMYLKLHPILRPALIMCPATLKLNWEKEVKMWLGNKERIEILYGKKPYFISDKKTILIINYDILGERKEINIEGKKRYSLLEGGWWDILKDMNIKIIIADECQRISNFKNICTKAFIKIKKKVNKFIPLSGTPIKNKPSEFFTVLSILDPVTFPNRYSYLQKFCNPVFNGYGTVYKGISNGDELFRLIYPLMIRRKKEEVLKELPGKTTIIVPLECNKTKLEEYFEMYKKIFEKDLSKKLKIRNEIELLKQLAYAAKRDFVIDWIKTFLESDEKLVLFAVHRKVLDDIQNNFKNICVRIDGSVKLEDRQKAIEIFQKNDKIKLFLGQIRAAGEGITLTAASNCVFVELDWNPATHHQASDRIHRIGQKAEAIFIYYLIANGTIENMIIELLQEKEKTLGKILDGKEGVFIENDIYDDLIEKIKKNKGKSLY